MEKKKFKKGFSGNAIIQKKKHKKKTEMSHVHKHAQTYHRAQNLSEVQQQNIKQHILVLLHT